MDRQVVAVAALFVGAASLCAGAPRHAYAHVLHGPTGQTRTTEQYVGHVNAAGAQASLTVGGLTGWSWAVSSSRQQTHQTSLPLGFYSNGHAGHHGQDFGGEGGFEGGFPMVPAIGSEGSLMSIDHGWRAGPAAGMVTYELAPSFVQLDMAGLGLGEFQRGGWMSEVEGAMGRVMLTGTVLADRSMQFEVLLEGIYSGMGFSLESLTSERSVLRLNGMQRDFVADLEEFTVHLDAAVIPAPGSAALALGLGALGSRRRR